jgi:hypothetical protein
LAATQLRFEPFKFISNHGPRIFEVENKIKMDVREIGWDGVDWIELAQDRDQWRALVNTVMNHRVP